MNRTWADEMGRMWEVDVSIPEEAERGDAVLHFDGEEADERAIAVVGPLEDVFAELTDDALQHALDATASGEGILLVEADAHLWWARGPDDDPMTGSWTAKFSDGSDEYMYRGRLPDALEDLSEDEILEILDELRGRTMDEMDVSQA